MKSNRGFTIVEIVIALSIMAILAAFAVPAFDTIVKKSSVKKTQEDLYADLILARSESIARARNITVCPVADPKAPVLSCSANPGDWNMGWIVFTDTDEDAELDPVSGNIPADEVIRVYGNNNSNFMSIEDTGVTNFITYNSRGLLDTGNRTFTFCNNSIDFKHALIISSGTGRVRYSEKAADGSELTCI